MNDSVNLRLMTYNIGGVKKPSFNFSDAVKIISELSPDVLCIQEITKTIRADGNIDDQVQIITERIDGKTSSFFGPTISLPKHFHPAKDLFVQMLFDDVEEWHQGNALLIKSTFSKLSDSSQKGKPYSLPVYNPARYEGNRNTDPRAIIISRANFSFLSPYIVGTHLTTLVSENSPDSEEFNTIKQTAQNMRFDQCMWISKILNKHVIQKNYPTFLLGDFNAPPNEPCIQKIIEEQCKFSRLIPSNKKSDSMVDHIFIFPGENYIEYDCYIYDDTKAASASDHFPVFADITIFSQKSEKFLKNRSGVVKR